MKHFTRQKTSHFRFTVAGEKDEQREEAVSFLFRALREWGWAESPNQKFQVHFVFSAEHMHCVLWCGKRTMLLVQGAELGGFNGKMLCCMLCYTEVQTRRDCYPQLMAFWSDQKDYFYKSNILIYESLVMTPIYVPACPGVRRKSPFTEKAQKFKTCRMIEAPPFSQKKNLACISLLLVPVLYSLERRADGWSQYWLFLYNCELIQFILVITSH